MSSAHEGDIESEPKQTEVQWSEFGLDPALVARIVATGAADVPIVNMTPVQSQMLRADNKADIFALSPTGSGKTIAFLATAMRDVIAGNGDGTLILSTTNTLRFQHYRTATQICPPTAQVVDVQSVTGHTVAKLSGHSGASVIVCTPAKWLDLMKPAKVGAAGAKNAVEYAATRLKMVVLDEVDEMVRNPSFKKEIERVIAAAPNARLVSTTATGSPEAQDFAKKVLRDPLRNQQWERTLVQIEASTGVRAASDTHAEPHTHHLVSVQAESLFETMASLLVTELALPDSKIIVFFPTAMMADFARQYLEKATKLGNVHLLHSKLSSGAIRKAESQFRGCRPCALLASNIMARGMDVPDINLVIQVGVSAPEEYVQRVGRSGRAGRKGRGILLVGDAEAEGMRRAITAKGIEFKDMAVNVAVPTSKNIGDIPGSAKAFKATLGAYKTHARTLGFSMRDVVALLQRVFLGAGQEIPTISSKNAKKLGLKPDDGIQIVANDKKEAVKAARAVSRTSASQMSDKIAAVLPVGQERARTYAQAQPSGARNVSPAGDVIAAAPGQRLGKKAVSRNKLGLAQVTKVPSARKRTSPALPSSSTKRKHLPKLTDLGTRHKADIQKGIDRQPAGASGSSMKGGAQDLGQSYALVSLSCLIAVIATVWW